MSSPRDERVWEQGWDGHRDAQARRMAALPLAERLAWLEEAHALVVRMRGGRLRDEDVEEGSGG